MRRALEIAAGLALALLAVRASGALAGSSSWRPAPAAQRGDNPAVERSAADGAKQAKGDRPAAAEGDVPLRDQADEVVSYTLRASLDPVAHTIRGEGTIVWRNTSRVPQREIYVHLYLNAWKSDRTVFARGAPGFRGGGAVREFGSIEVEKLVLRETAEGGRDIWPKGATTPGEPEDETDIRVELPAAVEPGGAITLDVAWTARLPSIVLRTGYEGSFHMVGQWYPKLARLEPDGAWAHFPFHRLSEFYADFGAYEVTIDAPDGYTIGATGQLVREAREGGRVSQTYAERSVHDFAFTAWDAFQEAKATSDDGVELRCLYPAGHERAAAIELEMARFGLDRLGRLYGRYPYRTLTIVHPPIEAPEAGGMEYPTLITTGGEWYLPFTGGRFIETVTLHELAHQWFYGMVATNEHAHPFLDEGLTSFAEIDALEARYPGASAAAPRFGVSIGLPAVHRAAALEAHRSAAVGQAASEFATGFDYGTLVYSRAAIILLSLAGAYGDDALRGALGVYARRYRFRHPGPSDFIGVIRESLGEDAARALHVALFERGWVDYAVEDIEPLGANPQRGRALARRRGSVALPVDVDLIGQDGHVERVRWDAKEEVAWLTYSGAAPLDAVLIDPERRVLLDEDLSNNAARRSPPSVGLRALERATFAAELGLLLVVP